ncbi:Retrovirus-related Pol polyprotein from transposon TNT 1-94 [Cardamine amara subsp. amara]|uniref:Retrovirus-related Pol polyprotein from transposon TNT 1-94 n=1 Tax=Cardamine amara subsp. amara TaxID=228776 RepID=A0ABD1C7H0_CARAN
MIEEMQSLNKIETWEIVSKPDRKKTIGCKWIFKIKEDIPRVKGPRYKARLVAKGFTQVEGVDYNEIFLPVVKHVSIRIMLSVVVNFDLELEQIDVKTAFLHGTLDEVIYMDKPEGFIEKGSEDKTCLLKKSLYGLKQSPRQWNQKFDWFMKSQGFQKCVNNPCVYHKGSIIDDQVFLLLYVDNMLVAAKDSEQVKQLKKSLSEEFEMKDLGPATRILGMDIIRDRKKGTLKLSQNSNFMAKPGREHWGAVK